MNTKIKLIGLVAGLMTIATTSAYAADTHQSPPPPPGMSADHAPRPDFHRRDPFDFLQLSVAQKEKVKTILESHKIDHKDSFGDMIKSKDQLNKLIASDDYSPAKAKDIIVQGSQSMTDALVNKSIIDHEIYKILTPEQKQKFIHMLNEQPHGPRPDFREPPKLIQPRLAQPHEYEPASEQQNHDKYAPPAPVHEQ